MKKEVCTHIHRTKEYLGVKQPQEVSSPDQAAHSCIQSGLESPRGQRLSNIFSRLFQPVSTESYSRIVLEAFVWTTLFLWHVL